MIFFFKGWAKDRLGRADEGKLSIAGTNLFSFGKTDHAQWGICLSVDRFLIGENIGYVSALPDMKQ